MTVQADFYLLNRPGLELEAVLRTLVKKARSAGFRISIITRDADQTEMLDEALWQGTGFLPHETLIRGKKTGSPISLAMTTENLEPLVINLSCKPVSAFAKLKRVLEIVPNEDHMRQQSRDHYRNYQQLGWQLKMHKIN
ncbi:MAG: DNA polymerase III subunit chi [Proteobacteria bacterium]|nr:DNA polymerase III subunit chi [Pseudomonadota bacterium]